MRRNLLRVLLSLFALGVLFLLVHVVGFRATIEAVKRAGPLAALSIGAVMAVLFSVQALIWILLNRTVRHRIRFRTLFGANVVGMAVNIMAPAAYLGGEPAKLLYVGRKSGLPYQELAGTIVLAKYLEAGSFVLVFGTSVGIAVILRARVLLWGPWAAVGVCALAMAGVLAGFGVVLLIALRRSWKPITRILRVLRRVRPRSSLLARLVDRAGGMEEQASTVFREEGRTALAAFALFLVAHLAVLSRPAIFFALGSGLDLGLGGLCLLFIAGQALLLLQIIPSSLGTLDGGIVGIFTLLGLPSAEAAAYLLCTHFFDACVVAAGASLGAPVGAGILAKTPRPATPDRVEDAGRTTAD